MTTNDDKAAHDSGTGFYRLHEVLKLVPAKKSTIYRWVKTGYFPRPCPIGPRTSAWPRREIFDWCEARTAERDAKGAK